MRLESLAKKEEFEIKDETCKRGFNNMERTIECPEIQMALKRCENNKAAFVT